MKGGSGELQCLLLSRVRLIPSIGRATRGTLSLNNQVAGTGDCPDSNLPPPRLRKCRAHCWRLGSTLILRALVICTESRDLCPGFDPILDRTVSAMLLKFGQNTPRVLTLRLVLRPANAPLVY